MTYEKAIDCLKADKEYIVDYKVCDGEEIDVAIEALEKQIPKKPMGDLNSVPHYRCPVCKTQLSYMSTVQSFHIVSGVGKN